MLRSMTGQQDTVTIGELARLSGVGVETIRYYERERLLEQPRRPANGFRRYPAEAVDRLLFIRHAKDLGFTLDDVREILRLRTKAGAPCSAVRMKALLKVQEIDERIVDLQRLRSALVSLADRCTGEVAIESCSILAAIDANPPEPKNQGPNDGERQRRVRRGLQRVRRSM